MQNMLSVALNDLRVYFSDRGNLIGMVALPVIMTLFLGGVFGGGGGTRQLRLDVADQDNSPQSQQFIDVLRAVNPALLICPHDQNAEDVCQMAEAETLDEATALERVHQGDTDALLVIPAGYSEQVASPEALTLPYYSTVSLTENDPVLQSIQAVLQQVNGAVIAARMGAGLAQHLDLIADDADRLEFATTVYAQAQADWTDPAVRVQYAQTEASQTQGGADGFGQSVPGMATFFVVFSVLGAGMYGLVRDRTAGTLPRMAVMPVRRAEIIGGKILAYFSIGIIQFIIIFIVGLVVGVNFGRDPLALLLVMAAYTLCITALGFVLAPRMRNENQISALTTLLGMVMGALGGAWWPLDIAPPFMQVVGHITPVAWAMDAFRELFFFGGGLGDVLLPLGVLIVATVVLFVIGIRAFKFT